jgi:hypothetical protein
MSDPSKMAWLKMSQMTEQKNRFGDQDWYLRCLYSQAATFRRYFRVIYERILCGGGTRIMSRVSHQRVATNKLGTPINFQRGSKSSCTPLKIIFQRRKHSPLHQFMNGFITKVRSDTLSPSGIVARSLQQFANHSTSTSS